ncbi:MAG: UvrD-helicase domain-containing protein [Clostridiaceae bacterium]|nr:UvrD-helicase domain-containing protein [Clostridiaceae bacterium]
MANKWTEEQLNAITEKGCNLLVAAAAGAGKTAVLVERIIRKITDSENPVDIDRLLVVTFTNAAATEMRERIGNALADALEADPSSANLQKQMTLLDRASIMTLHSFCLEVVRSHFHALDLDPMFRIADETECTLLRLDALEQLFEQKYENENKDGIFFQLVDSYGGGRDDSSLRDIVMALHRFTGSHPWPGQWLAAQAEAYNAGASACLSSTPWARVLLKAAAAELQGLSALLKRAAERASHAEGLEPYCGVLDGDMEKLDALLVLCHEALAKAASTDVSSRQVDGPAASDNPATRGNQTAIGDLSAKEKQAAKENQTAIDNPDAIEKQAARENQTKSVSSDIAERQAVPASSIGFNEIWDRLHAAFSSFEPARLPRCGKNADKVVQEEVKAARSTMKERIKKLCASGFDASSGDIAKDFGRLYPQLKYLSDMVMEYEDIYRQKKKDKGLLDFNDLEHFCLKVLLEDEKPTAAAKELRERYEEILVDEYQDSNLIQELILGTVSGNQDNRHNIFMVGDVKQSIYRFRQARPELFLSKYMTYHHEHGFDDRVIQLYKNFRSRPEVISCVNYIFRQIMSSEVGELDYTENEHLNPGAEFPQPQEDCTVGGAVELHVMDLTSDKYEITADNFAANQSDQNTDVSKSAGMSENTDVSKSTGMPMDTTISEKISEHTGRLKNASIVEDTGTTQGQVFKTTGENDESIDLEEESLDNIQHEARLVGSRIKSLITHRPDGYCVFDKKLGRCRPAEYRDIVILMRTTRNWADVFSDELTAMGIPAYADAGLGYFRTVEVETMLALLQIIDNPLQDIPMLAVLRSPIGEFSTDELADIRLADRSATIYEAMVMLADTGENKLEKIQSTGTVVAKTRKFIDDLQRWRDISQYTPTDELVWQLLLETGYYSYAGILPGGIERQANLRMLFERARQYEETSYKGLFNFINFINRLRSGGGDMGSAKILGENDNVVRIMSIHKSKGLEFPIVIAAGCGKKFNMQDLNSSILLHQDLGFGPDIVDLDKRTITPSLPKMAIRQKLKLETLSEEMRILYVAFTRAREKLIITGCVKDIKKQCAAWCSNAAAADDKLPSYSMMQAGTYLDWIGTAVARHSSADVIRRIAEVGNAIRLMSDDSVWKVRFWGKGVSFVRKAAAENEQSIKEWLDSAEGNLPFEQDEESNESGKAAENSKETDGESFKSPTEQKANEDNIKNSTNREMDKNSFKSPTDHETTAFIKALEWVYPYHYLTSIPAKISVTELKRRFMQEEQSESAAPFVQPMIERPLFMEPGKGLSAAHRGTVMHFVMQHLELGRLSGISNNEDLLNEIGSQLTSMKDRELLTQAEAESVRLQAVAEFFSSSVGKLMLDMHGSVHRETTFNVEVKCSEIYGSTLSGQVSDTDSMLLQGVIDCWIDTGEGLVLLDYKTDYVPAGGSDVIKQRYKVQIDYYTRALEKITGRKVVGRYLYLFSSGELIQY